jgi:hypothetical protein
MYEKSYYLFKIRVWSVITTEPEEETTEDEELPEIGSSLSASVTLSADDRPFFGFTPWTPEPWGDYED